MQKTRFAIVGCGDVANEMGRVNRFIRRLEIAACMDIDINRAEKFAKKFKVRETYSDYDALLENSQLDFVYLSVPHYLHYPLIQKALEKGLDVLCEKPVTIDLEDAFDLCRRSQQSGIKIGVNYQYRYDKACYAIARAAYKGELGEIRYIRCNIPWFRNPSYFSQSAWHAKLDQSGGGTLITQASHMVDVALWIVNSRPQKVTGLSKRKINTDVEVEDLFMGTIETENDVQIELCTSMVATPERCITMEIYGSKGTAVYEGHFFPKVKFHGVKITKEKPEVGGLHAMIASLEAYRRWTAGELKYAMPIENSLAVLATVKALYKAAESGKTELVDQRYLEFCE
jgi:UDP-N-acetyl-2-amino-2-deoxyglucuronate dehydrogenase